MKIINKPLRETADVSRGEENTNAKIRNTLYVLIFFITCYLLLAALGSWLGAHIPDTWEKKLAHTASETLTSDENAETPCERSTTLLNQLIKDETLRDLNYHLFLLDWDTPNAVAIPGGGIGVTKQLLETIKTDPGLAFVLAHELGHHQHRHITKRLGRGILLNLATSLIRGPGNINPLQSAVSLAELNYSRDQETQADLFALQLIHKKRGTTQGATEFFEHIQKTTDEHSIARYLRTHPLTAQRIADIKAHAKHLDTQN